MVAVQIVTAGRAFFQRPQAALGLTVNHFDPFVVNEFLGPAASRAGRGHGLFHDPVADGRQTQDGAPFRPIGGEQAVVRIAHFHQMVDDGTGIDQAFATLQH